MKNILLLFFVMALSAFMIPASASAQSPDNTDSFERGVFYVGFGFLGGYSLSDEEIYTGQDFGFTFSLSDSMLLGFRSIRISNGPGNIEISLLNFGYLLGPALGIDFLVGSANNADFVGGVDGSIYLFRGNDGAVKSSLKLKAGYLFFDDGIGDGFLNAGLVGSIGY